MNDDDDFNPSVLGTKEYWESLYQQEIDNYLDHQDSGEIWFGKGLMVKIVKWISDKFTPGQDNAIVDIGCGNGHLLLTLYQRGYTNLTGLDYAGKSIDLVKKMCQDNGINGIKLMVADVLDLTPSSSNSQLLPANYHLIIDKGTFDAICLNPATNLDQAKAKYLGTIDLLLQNDGLFLIASCNWTKDEIIRIFTQESSSPSFLEYYDQIETPQMTFGGKKGNNVTCIIFKKLAKS